MKIGFLITARLKSTRLKRKVLLDIEGKPVLAHMVDRLRLSKSISDIVLCTSVDEQDDDLEKFADDYGILCFRGHRDDVIKRLCDATNFYNFDYVLNITADCPFVDHKHVDKIVDKYIKTKADLITAFDLPHGAYSYGMKPDALNKVVEIKDDIHTEVWGRYFFDTDLFNVQALDIEDKYKQPNLRMTLDYPEDFTFFKTVFAKLYHDNNVFDLDEILELLKKHPDIEQINSKCEEKYFVRVKKQSNIKLKKRHKVKRAVIIGAGSIGQRHIRNLSKIGISEIIALRTKRGHYQTLDPSLSINEVYNWEDVYSFNPDIAVISNPTSLHLNTVTQLIGKVKGIFIEKPVSNTLDGIQTILDKLEKHKTVTFVGYNMQFHPIIKEISNLLESDRLGKALVFQGNVGQWLPDWHPYEDYKKLYCARKELGGGALLSLIHEIQMAISWFGTVNSVFSIFPKSELLDLDVDVNSNLMLEHKSHVVTQLHFDLLQRPSQRTGVVSCERGWMRYDFTKNEVIVCSEEKPQPQMLWQDTSYDWNDGYVDMMETFIQYVEEGRARHDFDIWEGLKALKVAINCLNQDLQN